MSASGPEEICPPGVRPALPDVLDLELQKALLDVSVLPVVVTPLVDPVVTRPPLPVPQSNDQDPIPWVSPFREVTNSPILDVFPSYLESPPGSEYEPMTSQITPSLREDNALIQLSSHATMDQYLSSGGYGRFRTSST